MTKTSVLCLALSVCSLLVSDHGTARAAGVLQVLPKPPDGRGEAASQLAGPPLSLTASDGTGQRIVSLKARAVVEDPLAFTELQLTFHNPQPRQIEGHFEI